MKNKQDFKYTSQFSVEIKAHNVSDSPKRLNISEASINSLNDHIPYANRYKNVDLLGVAFEAALVNQFNLNGDGVDSIGGINMLQGFPHKPINIEHDRNKIVGHIVQASFSERVFGKHLFSSDVIDTDEVFSITLGGVIYKVANQPFSQLMQELAEKKDQKENPVYASWEIGFDEIYAAVGQSYLLSECEIIKDPAEVEKLKKYMKAFGGNGKDGKNHVFRLATGDIVPLGIGLTTEPAADVKSIYVEDFDYRNDEEKDVEVSCCSEKEQKKKKNISHSNKKNVTKDTEKIIMEKEEIAKMINEAFASKESEKESKEQAAASITEKVVEAINSANESFKAEKEALASEKAKAEKALEDQKKELESVASEMKTLKEEFETQKKELETLKSEKDQLESQAKFDSRMDEVKSIYELDENQTKIVAKRIGAIDSDEEFGELKEEFEVVFASVNKETLKKEAEEKEKQTATASKTDDDPVTKSGEQSTGTTATASTSSDDEDSFENKFKKAFSKESVKIS